MSQQIREDELNSPRDSRPPIGKRLRGMLAVWLAVAWLAGFFLFFYSFTLPNSNPPVSRLDLWKTLPEHLSANIEADPAQHALPSSWSNLSQRFDVMLVAGVILCGAWGVGNLLLRLLNLPTELRWAERTVFACGLGLSGLSLVTLGCGLAGNLSRPLFAGILGTGFVLELLIRVVDYLIRRRSMNASQMDQPRSRRRLEFSSRFLLHTFCLGAVIPFLLAMFLGAMLPSTDFDVKEYHLQGPKEFFQAGRVTFLPHNVYTSFPFLTEMLSLLGMVLRDDWYRGALAGKLVLMCFSPLTALGLYAAGKRWYSPTAGVLAATVYLTTPWVYRIAIIAYAEGGLSFFLSASLLALMFAAEKTAQSPRSLQWFILSGLLAGSAMACKYPGVVQVVIPLGLAACALPFVTQTGIAERRRVSLQSAVVFSLGVLLAVSPWLMKNTAETGNPVYPLMYSVFGGKDWDADLDARWKAGHRTPAERYTVKDLGVNFIDVTAKSDWLSPLLFGLAPLAFLAAGNRRAVRMLWVYVAFLFFAWWLLTHRIDRFWVPMIPVVALLAGAGAVWNASAVWKFTCGAMISAAVLFNLGFITTALCGFNAYLSDSEDARRVAEETAPGIAFLNKHLPENARVLCVGEAQVFDARFPLVYNTVFDRSLFEEWCRSELAGELKDPVQILRKFRDEGITHVFVNWQEIARYRKPGSYGYTDFVTLERFAELQKANVLGTGLNVTMPGRRDIIVGQVFPVRQ